MSDAPLLEIRDLRVTFATDEGPVPAVDGLTLTVPRGRTLGVVGESGSGKTVTFLAALGLLERRGTTVSGEALFDGRDLLTMPAAELRRIRGGRIGMIFQDPMTALHPMLRIGDQIAETVRAHRGMGRREAGAAAVAALAAVGIPAPEQRARQYSFELSGGMRQRAMIAMALALEPELLIADEPTTALDVTVQAQILDLLAETQERLGLGIVLITHDLGVVGQVADEVVVMYAGRPVESGGRGPVLGSPRHPYTWGLLGSMPRADARTARLTPIAGAPPSASSRPPGCAFHPRCPHRFAGCDTTVPALADAAGDGHADACLLPPGEKDRIRAGGRGAGVA